MKITKKQLHEIIKKSLLNEGAPLVIAGIGAYAVAGWLFGKTYKMKVAQRAENQEFTNLATELEGSLGNYETMFKDLYAFAEKCNDQGLIAEIQRFVRAGDALSQIIGSSFDMSDAVGATLDVATQAGSQSSASAAGLTLAKKATRGASLTAKNIVGPFLAVVLSGYDVYEAESAAAALRAKGIKVSTLNDDIQGFLKLHKKLERGELGCMP